VAVDPVGADQEEQVGPAGAAVCLPLLLGPALDLGADLVGLGRHVQPDPVGVEDHPLAGAFDVERAAVLAVFAPVGDDGVGLGVAAAGGLEVGQLLLQPGQVGGQASLRLVGLAELLLGRALPVGAGPGQGLLLLLGASLVLVGLLAQLPQAGPGFLHP